MLKTTWTGSQLAAVASDAGMLASCSLEEGASRRTVVRGHRGFRRHQYIPYPNINSNYSRTAHPATVAPSHLVVAGQNHGVVGKDARSTSLRSRQGVKSFELERFEARSATSVSEPQQGRTERRHPLLRIPDHASSADSSYRTASSHAYAGETRKY